MTTPTSRRRDVRASTATAPAADEERGTQLSPALAKKREDGCRLLLLRYTSRARASGGWATPFEAPRHRACLPLARISATRRILSRNPMRGNPPARATLSLPFSHLPASARCLFPSRRRTQPYLRLSLSPRSSFLSQCARSYAKPPRSPSPPRRYPTLPHRVSSHQHTPLGPLTLPAEHPPARALPASSDPHGHDREPRPTESCRLSASQPSDSPPRHATPRVACVSLCIAFQKPARA